MYPFILAKVFADFQGAFYKKPLEARFGTAVPTLNTPTARRVPCGFSVIYPRKKHG